MVARGIPRTVTALERSLATTLNFQNHTLYQGGLLLVEQLKKSTHLYHDSLSIVNEMSDELAGQFIKNLLILMQNGSPPPDVNFSVKMALHPFAKQFERDSIAYKLKCEQNRINGSKGGRPPNNPDGSPGTQANPNNPDGSLGTQANPNNHDTDTDTDTGTDINYAIDLPQAEPEYIRARACVCGNIYSGPFCEDCGVVG